nr:MAG TPA: hypothetical protein [Caudoviricetes sp.]
MALLNNSMFKPINSLLIHFYIKTLVEPICCF